MANKFRMFGIDVSAHQGNIDWAKVKKENPDLKFAILKATEGTSYVSNAFERNYKGCKDNGIYVGAYHYLNATKVPTAVKEAQFFISKLKGKQFEMPVYLDIETSAQVSVGKARCTEMTKAFCKELEKAGFFVGVYSMDSFFTSNLDREIQDLYTCWPANVSASAPKYTPKYDMWQYSWKGNIPGVPTPGNIDLNYCYKDFPTLIKSIGKNGFKAGSGPSTGGPNNGSDTDIENQLAIKAHKFGYIQDVAKWEKILKGKTTATSKDILDLFKKIV